jgi:hypothetical protein
VQGWAPEHLLDSYHTERHPVGRMVMRTSGAIIRLVMIRPWVQRTARNLVGGTALRVGPIARRVAGTISGIGIDYPGGDHAHALAGKRAEDILLAGDGRRPARLYELLREGRFVLLVPASATPAGVTPADLPAAAPWTDRVRVATPAGPRDTAILVRPDGYIAWATDETDPGNLDNQIRSALVDWCGTPSRHTVPAAT